MSYNFLVMAEKKKNVVKQTTEQKAEMPQKTQKFVLKKPFETTEKKYKAGEIYEHSDKKVINFLKSKNII